MKATQVLATVSMIGLLLAVPCRSFAASEDGIANQFLGMWRLVSQTYRFADGTERLDPKRVAYLTYSDTGHMCYVAMDPDRAMWKSESAPTPEEALTATTKGFGAYCARVEIHVKEGYVLHHVEIAGSPNRVGQTWKRWFTFEGPNQLVLRADQPAPPMIENTLIWERVEKQGDSAGSTPAAAVRKPPEGL